MWMKIFAAIIIIGFLLAQLFRVDMTIPPVQPGKDILELTQPPVEVAKMLQDACYDCHSHKTEYPFYSRVTPLNYWMRSHIEEGLDHLNFSAWGTYSPSDRRELRKEIAEVVREKEMPLTSYTFMHPEARLSDQQRDRLAAWAELAVDGKQEIPTERRHQHEDDYEN